MVLRWDCGLELGWVNTLHVEDMTLWGPGGRLGSANDASEVCMS